MKCVIYVEGGGDRDDLRDKCRRGFSKLLERAGFSRPHKPAIRAHGGRAETFRAFCLAWKQKKQGDIIVLLVDSEGPIPFGNSKWNHLGKNTGDQWTPPPGAGEDDVFLMVQVMETWILVDKECLGRYFGQGFLDHHLPSRPNLEEEPKRGVHEKLAAATKQARTKGTYGKGSHSFELIGLIDPGKLESLPHANQFLNVLKTRVKRQG